VKIGGRSRKYHILDFSNWKNHDAFELGWKKIYGRASANNFPQRR